MSHCLFLILTIGGTGGSGVFLNVKIKQNIDLNSIKFKDPLFFIFAQNAIAPAIFGSQSQISHFGVISWDLSPL
jgi:hypothetical protein